MSPGQFCPEPSRATSREAARRDTPTHLELNEVLVLRSSVARRALLPWANDLFDAGLAADVTTFLEGGQVGSIQRSVAIAQLAEEQAMIHAGKRKKEGLTLFRTEAMLFESSFEQDGHIIAAGAAFDPADDAAAAGGRGVKETDTSFLMLRTEENAQRR